MYKTQRATALTPGKGRLEERKGQRMKKHVCNWAALLYSKRPISKRCWQRDRPGTRTGCAIFCVTVRGKGNHKTYNSSKQHHLPCSEAGDLSTTFYPSALEGQSREHWSEFPNSGTLVGHRTNLKDNNPTALGQKGTAALQGDPLETKPISAPSSTHQTPSSKQEKEPEGHLAEGFWPKHLGSLQEKNMALCKVTQRGCVLDPKYSFACRCFMQNKLQKEATGFVLFDTTRANLEITPQKAINSVQDHPLDVIFKKLTVSLS